MLTTKLDDSYAVEIAGKRTFLGVLAEHYDDIFRRCKDITKSAYNGMYNRHILPKLANRSMDELGLEDYEAVIQKIKETGLKPVTLQHYRYLIRTVVKCAVEHNICQDVLYGSIYSIPPNEGEDIAKKNEFVRKRKSLKVSEEKRLCQELMTNPKQDGISMGLVLMFCHGLRNGEACGVKFSAIREMENYPGHHCIWIYETTTGGTNQLKAGGKTRNAPRILPITAKEYEFYMARKAWIQELINKESADFLEKKRIKSVEELPVACKITDYTKHCSSKDLTAAGRLLLKKIRVSEEEIAYIDLALQDEANRIEMGVVEKDPTAYLLRRNLGTHLYLLGFDEPEIQYFMGHDMEDLYAERNEYSNEEHLYEMFQKLRNRPLFNDEYPHEEIFQMSAEGPFSRHINNVHTANIHLKAKKAIMAQFHVTAAEPDDPIQAIIEGGCPKEAVLKTLTTHSIDVPRTINITSEYQGAYQKARIKKKQK